MTGIKDLQHPVMLPRRSCLPMQHAQKVPMYPAKPSSKCLRPPSKKGLGHLQSLPHSEFLFEACGFKTCKQSY